MRWERKGYVTRSDRDAKCGRCSAAIRDGENGWYYPYRPKTKGGKFLCGACRLALNTLLLDKMQ
ncbi:MAG: hypothetical protein GY851_29095 [bacterium]|nr:hypothetical protein [bacterium]